DTMADSFGKKRPARQTTPFIVSIAWRVEKLKSMLTGKSPLLTRESERVAHSKTDFDNAESQRTFPQFPVTPFEQTIRQAGRKYAEAGMAPTPAEMNAG